MQNLKNNQEDRMILVLTLLILSALSFWAFGALDSVDFPEQDRIFTEYKNNK